MTSEPSSPSSDRPLGVNPGDVIGGRYQITRVLGVGGTGAVFEARHLTIGRLVAIKVLLPELGANAIVAKRFLQEAQTANAVRHRNIVEVLDFGDDHGKLFMVMEYLEGESLSVVIRREAPMSPSAILALLDPVMSALGAAHERAIIHRDVKPQNIFVAHQAGEGPITKLIDFGIAKRIVSDDTQLTATGMILGTPAYMSPEQANGSRDVTAAADQYAFGAILFQALSGQIPHQADTYPAMLIAIVTQDPPDLATLRPDLPPALSAVVMRALHRDPRQRYPSIHALREALRPFAGLDARASVAPTPPRGSIPPVVRTRPDGSQTPPTAFPPPPSIAPSLVQSHPSQEPPAPRPRSSLSGVAIIVALSAVASVAFAVTVVLRTPPRTHAVDAGTVRVATPPAVPTAAEMVTFRIDVEPPTAAIEIDGQVLGRGYIEALRPKDGRRYQLRLSAPDHADVTEVLTASSDARISRVLVSMRPSVPVVVNAPPPRMVVVPGAPSTQPPSVPSPRGEHGTHGGHHPHIVRENPFQ